MSTEKESVNQKSVEKTIGTHDGTFHADEACAIWMLKQLNLYKNAKVIRTRDTKILDKLDVVVDVGGVYDEFKNRFDHHQKEFKDTFSENHETRLSSAGLIYKRFGRGVIRSFYPEISKTDLEIVYQKVYTNFIEALDGNDNGVKYVLFLLCCAMKIILTFCLKSTTQSISTGNQTEV